MRRQPVPGAIESDTERRIRPRPRPSDGPVMGGRAVAVPDLVERLGEQLVQLRARHEQVRTIDTPVQRRTHD